MKFNNNSMYAETLLFIHTRAQKCVSFLKLVDSKVDL